MDLTYSDLEASMVAYLLASRRYRRQDSDEPVLDQVLVARHDLATNILPLMPVGELPDEWLGLAVALTAKMLQDIPKDRRSEAVTVGAMAFAAIHARARVKQAFERARLRSIKSELPEFDKLLREELCRGVR